MPTDTEMTKREKIDAAVAVVQERAVEALRKGQYSGYTEAYNVATALADRGVLVRQERGSGYTEDRARRRLEGQAKRLLDEEAAKPDARILRFSSRSYLTQSGQRFGFHGSEHEHLPRLDGTRRRQYGQAVSYTTPEFYERAVAVVEAAEARDRERSEELKTLIERAEMLRLPDPSHKDRSSVTYDLEGFRALVELVENLRAKLIG